MTTRSFTSVPFLQNHSDAGQLSSFVDLKNTIIYQHQIFNRNRAHLMNKHVLMKANPSVTLRNADLLVDSSIDYYHANYTLDPVPSTLLAEHLLQEPSTLRVGNLISVPTTQSNLLLMADTLDRKKLLLLDSKDASYFDSIIFNPITNLVHKSTHSTCTTLVQCENEFHLVKFIKKSYIPCLKVQFSLCPLDLTHAELDLNTNQVLWTSKNKLFQIDLQSCTTKLLHESSCSLNQVHQMNHHRLYQISTSNEIQLYDSRTAKVSSIASLDRIVSFKPNLNFSAVATVNRLELIDWRFPLQKFCSWNIQTKFIEFDNQDVISCDEFGNCVKNTFTRSNQDHFQYFSTNPSQALFLKDPPNWTEFFQDPTCKRKNLYPLDEPIVQGFSVTRDILTYKSNGELSKWSIQLNETPEVIDPITESADFCAFKRAKIEIDFNEDFCNPKVVENTNINSTVQERLAFDHELEYKDGHLLGLPPIKVHPSKVADILEQIPKGELINYECGELNHDPHVLLAKHVILSELPGICKNQATEYFAENWNNDYSQMSIDWIVQHKYFKTSKTLRARDFEQQNAALSQVQMEQFLKSKVEPTDRPKKQFKATKRRIGF